MLTWWRSEVNRSFFLSFAACRMRASACDTLTQSCAWRVLCRSAFPLVPVLGSHWLRGGWLRVVRRLHSYYSGVRLPASVHHRLQLLAFPMRTKKFEHCLWPDAGSPSFRCTPFARDVFFDPGRVATPRAIGVAHVAFDLRNSLRPCGVYISWLNSDTPRNRCVCFVAGVAVGSRNTCCRVPC